MIEPSKKPAAKRPVKRMKAGNTPAPTVVAPTCGHDGHCMGGTCNVRYVGPTSQITDHKSHMVAEASTRIWPAAVVTGLALVVTGAIAFQSVKAEASKTAQQLQRQNANRADVARIIEQLNRIERVTTETRDFLKGDESDSQKLENTMPKQ